MNSKHQPIHEDLPQEQSATTKIGKAIIYHISNGCQPLHNSFCCQARYFVRYGPRCLNGGGKYFALLPYLILLPCGPLAGAKGLRAYTARILFKKLDDLFEISRVKSDIGFHRLGTRTVDRWKPNYSARDKMCWSRAEGDSRVKLHEDRKWCVPP